MTGNDNKLGVSGKLQKNVSFNAIRPPRNFSQKSVASQRSAQKVINAMKATKTKRPEVVGAKRLPVGIKLFQVAGKRPEIAVAKRPEIAGVKGLQVVASQYRRRGSNPVLKQRRRISKNLMLMKQYPLYVVG